ncbi:LytR C-terminal domain-containing protein [Rhodohalobacter sp.]|uniref:LytR C-terminal domain-containing protein n=1 Tax=Rhodohalobacter sp. TaxID=1974210 RepID=UPI002ACD5CF7|nr:LytR C-terminal domain-containing protein [Rhodohalobacter sp.]MDZ7755372.1 LytR C-terminal domain-containing protein [Rhodohalobacter sp.]
MTQESRKDQTNNLILNSVIGFLSVLLLLLLFALGTRLLYPRIVNERVVEDPALISNVIQMEVLNGVGISGLANEFTGTLRQFGFDVVETGNFDHFDVPNTLVISRNGQVENARRVAHAIGIDEEFILREESPEFYLDVTLVIGNDFENLNL